MSHRGVPSWPPVWTRSRTHGAKIVTGEIGVLTYVYSNRRVSNKCFLVIDHEQETYVGSLVCRDRSVCAEIADFLRHHIGTGLREIGDMDLSKNV
jgi:hypothetical protein